MSIQERLEHMLNDENGRDEINEKPTEEKEKPEEEKLDQLGMIMAYENGELSDTETIKLFSDLVRTGLAWKLQGHYGRTAKSLMDAGYLDSKGKVLKEEEEVTKETKSSDVAEMFINDSFPKEKNKNWGTANIRIVKEKDGWALFSYNNPILYRSNGSEKIFFNKTKYSSPTSSLQSKIEKVSEARGVDLINVDERGINDQIEKD